MNIIHKFRQLFCKHEYEKVDWFENISCGIAYSMRVYKCAKCGKEIIVDGRKDRYAK